MGDVKAYNAIIFQSTFPRGERPLKYSSSAGAEEFQSTFPRGERLQKWLNPYPVSEFQSTFPRGERHQAYNYNSGSYTFQSTFPRGERHMARQGLIDSVVISIHVPARGTTKEVHYRVSVEGFQSTFPRGERPRKCTTECLLRDFNPRSREGNDINDIAVGKTMPHFNPRSREGNDKGDMFAEVPAEDISIHVPARGTTRYWIRPSRRDSIFQSTFPRGERHFLSLFHEGNQHFNPRSREGNDPDGVDVIFNTNKFQSTFPRGERPGWHNRVDVAANFNPRSREGNDGDFTLSCCVQFNFNPRSREGNDNCTENRYRLLSGFQSTFPRGERQMFRTMLGQISTISIHVPARGTTEECVSCCGDVEFQSTFPRGERRDRCSLR